MQCELTQGYPIGRKPRSITPSKEKNEKDEEYLYNNEIPFDTPTKVEYENVYNDEEAEDAPIVTFTKLQRQLNHLPESVVDNINAICWRYNIPGSHGCLPGRRKFIDNSSSSDVDELVSSSFLDPHLDLHKRRRLRDVTPKRG
ncbi:hypothetical protein RF11_12198 [Thelohanellus kitauei]|uniref:Uncharacterized protein n=1 Tax=Thelohanellus kitauei TaxID=669202 RepID=A0A0C2MUD9_THEKT|nr:hypothetical protein RF11_12198 [Thelohanellus kitauei]